MAAVPCGVAAGLGAAPLRAHEAAALGASEVAAEAPAPTAAALDALVAPVALNPDALLAQVLVAATCPLDVIKAARWTAANANADTVGDPVLTRTTMAAVAALAITGAAFAEPARYDSPDAAAAAFRAALEAGGEKPLRAVFGPVAEDLLLTGDPGEDRENRRDPLAAWSAMGRVGVDASGDVATIYVGREQWPFPIPLVRDAADGWAFDAEVGRETILARRIDGNELDVIVLLRAHVRVQADDGRTDWDGDGVMEFAAHIISSEGGRDGLYWPSAPGEVQSPIGDFVARAAAGGFSVGDEIAAPEPYLGYIHHILPGEGPNAPGGAMDCIVDGAMVAGHAPIAYPATTGVDGVMSFLAGANGHILQADLGEATREAATAMDMLDPDAKWTLAE